MLTQKQLVSDYKTIEMQNFNLERLVRPNILNLQPYASARSEYQGEANIMMDANENPFDTGFNRYPDPLQSALKNKIAEVKKVDTKKIFLGNGSDEAIDLLIRIFCIPQQDHIITLPPTYGMYKVCAAISDVAVKTVPLKVDFQPDVDQILAVANPQSKLLFICSPNNPTGNNIHLDHIKTLLQKFNGIVVVDEAYIDFSNQESCLSLLDQYPNLVILQTFSKAWGLAGIRLGMAFASTAILGLFNKVKPPYNVNQLTQDAAYMALDELGEKEEWTTQILTEKTNLTESLTQLKCVHHIYPSDANFLLVKVNDAKKIYQHLINQGIVVRDRSNVILCDDCLRLTIGQEDENEFLLEALADYDFQYC